jgi:hypothetical protein
VSFTVSHSPVARPRVRRIVLTLAAAACAMVAPQAAMADVVVKDVFAMPVDPTTATEVAPNGQTIDFQNQGARCTAEPDNRLEYLTQGLFDPSRAPSSVGNSLPGEPDYIAPNIPSSADLTPALQAGGSADLCFGFTLTPNMQSALVRDTSGAAAKIRKRIDPTPTLGDDPDTRVYELGGETNPDRIWDKSNVTLVDGDDIETVEVTMPAGFAGVPDDIPQCSDADFGTGTYAPVSATCGSSIVGTTYVRLTTLLHNDVADNQWPEYISPIHLSTGGQANPERGLAGGGQVFNLTHGPGELARLGIMVAPALAISPTKFLIRLVLTPEGRIKAIAEAPRRLFYNSDIDPVTKRPVANAEVVPFYVESLGVRAWGAAADHPPTTFDVFGVNYTSGLTKDFAQWGTECTQPLSASVEVETYQGVKSSGTSPGFTLTGCDDLDFRPSIDVTTTETQPAKPTATKVDVSFGQNPEGEPRTALLRTAEVTLPKGLELGAQVASGADGLKLCSAAQFAKDSGAPNACPAGSSAGNVVIETPLIQKDFVGNVYLGEQSAVGELPKLYLEAAVEVPADYPNKADLPRIKLVGEVKANDDGSITTTFRDAPQLRFSKLTLNFPGGDHALFVTPRTCTPAVGTSKFTSWAGQVVERESSIQMTGCDGPAFAPTIAISSEDATAGASSPTTVTVAREDRSPWLKDVKVSLPTGFLADLNIPTECSAAASAAASCPESSRIATVTTLAGAGPKPLSLTGAMYLVERQDGAVAGASIVVRAKLGELDLGDVVVPARIDLRPTDAGLTLTTSAPTRFKNLALLLRTITVKLDRQGFPLNPTACGPLRASGEFTADTGATASPTTDVTYTGCAAKGFQPQLKAEFGGTIKGLEHPSVRVQMTPRKGDSNLRSVSVLLPSGASADLKNVNSRRCSNEAFNTGTCPAISKVGSVNATVSITPDKLVGDVYLVRIDGETLPGIGMSFTGRYTQRVLSRVKVDRTTGRLLTAFEAIPDLPLTSLDLLIEGGPSGPIQLSNEVCKQKSSWDATLVGQGGQSTKTTIPFDCSDPAPTSAISWTRKSGLTLTVTAPSGRQLQGLRVTLPKGFKILKSGVGRNLKVTATGGKVTQRVTSRTLTFKANGTGPTKLKLVLRTKGYGLPSSYKGRLKKGARLGVRTAVTLSGGAASTKQLSVKVR